MMKRLWFAILFSAIALTGICQSTKGITGKPDTSYSIVSAYASTIKTNPEAKIVTEIHSASVIEDKDISYCVIGGRKLLLDAFYPGQKSSTKRIAIIIIHGGGWRTGNRTLHYPLAQRLAESGYVCFTPEYRLSTEALYPAAVTDIKSAIRWVRKNATKYDIDENKIAVAGHSAGGELAAMMGATNAISLFEGDGCVTNISSTVNAVIDMDGLLAFIHPESGEGDDSKRISAATSWFGYSKTENPELWKQGSPLTHVGSHTPPTLFINSNVARMHAGRDDFIKIMNEFKIYSEIRSFDAPHSFVLFEPWFTPVWQTIDAFLKKVFKE
jgi:pectinesterase